MRTLLLSIALLLLLATSLAGKVVTASRGHVPESEPLSAVADILRSRGLAVTLPEPNVAPAWIVGTRGGCRVRVAMVSPQGWSQTIVQKQASGEHLSFAFAGRFYSEQPVLRTWLDSYRRRLVRYFGMPLGETVVSAVTISAPCPADIVREEDAAALSS